MRTRNSTVRSLIKVAAEALGCKRHVVYTRLNSMLLHFGYILKRVGASAIGISPHADECWSLSCVASATDRNGEIVPGSARFVRYRIDIAQFVDSPEATMNAFADVIGAIE